MSKLYTACILLTLLVVTTGCTAVKPWERGNLARPEMALSSDPLAATIKDHIYFAKEGSSSGSAVSGGGCGCN